MDTKSIRNTKKRKIHLLPNPPKKQKTESIQDNEGNDTCNICNNSTIKNNLWCWICRRGFHKECFSSEEINITVGWKCKTHNESEKIEITKEFKEQNDNSQNTQTEHINDLAISKDNPIFSEFHNMNDFDSLWKLFSTGKLEDIETIVNNLPKSLLTMLATERIKSLLGDTTNTAPSEITTEISTSLTIHIDAPKPSQSLIPAKRDSIARLLVHTEYGEKFIFNLSEPFRGFYIGRKNAAMDLDLATFSDSRTVSHKHCGITFNRRLKRFELESFGRNGTKLGGELLGKGGDKRMPLKSKSIIEVGRVIIHFEALI